MKPQTAIRLWPARVAAILMILAAGAGARYLGSPPGELRPEAEVAGVVSRFAFTKMALPAIHSRPTTEWYDVNPRFEHLKAWVSAVGASLAFSDFDEDGFDNDVCLVDPRSRDVVLAPAPGTPGRYTPFVLRSYVGSLFNPKTMIPDVCLPGDFNEDGLTDIAVLFHGRTPVLFLRRADPDHDGAALGPLADDAFKVAPLVPGSEDVQYGFTGVLADVDNDGHADIVVGNYFGDGARMFDPDAPPEGYMHDSFSRAFNGGVNRIYLWQRATSGPEPEAVFTEAKGVLPERELRAWTLALGAADLNKDGSVDLYFANDFGPDNLYLNKSTPGAIHLVRLEGTVGPNTPASKVLGRDSFKGMGIDFGDVNGDGYFDMFVSNIAKNFALNEGHFLWVSNAQMDAMENGTAPYDEAAERLGVAVSDWGWDTRLDDFDNDGVLEAVQATGFVRGKVDRWPELAEFSLGNDALVRHASFWPAIRPGHDLSGDARNPFYVRFADGRYYNVAEELGLGGGLVSRAIATADTDGDGDLELGVANQFAGSYYYRNDTPSRNGFVGLHVLRPRLGDHRPRTTVRDGHPRSPQDGVPALGALVEVALPDGHTLMRQIDGGSGHTGKRSPAAHFGLGHLAPDDALSVALTWRDGAGALHRETFAMTPGWHTVLLGG